MKKLSKQIETTKQNSEQEVFKFEHKLKDKALQLREMDMMWR